VQVGGCWWVWLGLDLWLSFMVINKEGAGM
jgi:hypothetical protein